jgi:hypothetical protein
MNKERNPKMGIGSGMFNEDLVVLAGEEGNNKRELIFTT